MDNYTLYKVSTEVKYEIDKYEQKFCLLKTMKANFLILTSYAT